MLAVKFLEYRDPLTELVELRLSITKVDDNLSFDVAPVVLIFKLLPALSPPDPLAGVLPCS